MKEKIETTDMHGDLILDPIKNTTVQTKFDDRENQIK